MSPILIAAIIMIVTFVMFFHPKVPNIAAAIFAALAFGMSGILDVDTVFNNFTSATCILMIGMMTIGGAMFQCGLAGWIGNRLIRITGTSEKGIQMAVLITTLVLATVCTGTATLMIMYPLMCSIALSSKISMSKIVAFHNAGSMSGSFMTFAGCGMIATSAGVLEASGYRMWSFFEIAWFGIPRAILLIAAVYFFAHKVLPDTYVMPDAEIAAKADSLPKKLTSRMILVGVILVLTITGFVVNSSVFPVHVCATLGALACLLTGSITPEQMYKSISWNTIFLIGGMSAFAKGMQASGFGQLVADSILRIVGTNPAPMLMIFIFIVGTGIITQFMSDNGAVALMAAIAVGIAQTTGVEPYAYVMACLVGSALCHLSVMASPSLAFSMQLGGYKPSFLVKWGLSFELLPALIAAMIMIPLIWL